MSWGDLAHVAPDIAAAGQRLLEDAPGVPGVAFLATVAIDGTPRINPFIPAIVDGQLCAFVIISPKQRDLDRTGAFAIHSRLGEADESFSVAGTARRVDEPNARERVAPRMPYADIDTQHILYEFALARALWTTWTTPTSPVHRLWKAPPLP